MSASNARGRKDEMKRTVLDLQLGDSSLDSLHSSTLSHLLGRVVGVASSSIPISILDDLGVEGDL